MFNSRLLRKMALFLLFTAVYFFSYFHRVAIPGTIFNELQIDFNLTANQIASLGTLVFYIYGILQFFIGIWLDYFGTNIIFIVSGFLLGIGSMMFAFSNGIFSLYLSRVLVGFGASVAYLTVVKKTEELFGSHLFSLMLGFACFIGYSGGLFATLPFERLVYAFGWRHAIAGLSWIFFILMLAILTVFIKTNAFSRAKNRIVLSDIKTTLLNRQTYPLILIVTINFSIYFLFQGIFGKKLLQDICITSSKLAASFTFVMMVITMFFVFLAGILTHIIRKRKPIIVILCFCCLFSCVLMLANVLVWRSTGIFLFSFILLAFAGGSAPLTITVMKESNPSNNLGTAVGFINGICYIGLAVIGNIAGSIMDRFSGGTLITSTAIIYSVEAYRAVIIFCLFLGLISFLLSFLVKETGNTKRMYTTPQ